VSEAVAQVQPKEAASRIVEAVSGGMSLRKACIDAGLSFQSFLRLTVADNDIAEQYAHARVSQATVHADEILEVADRDDLDPKDKAVRVDARKWVAARLHPKQYGDSKKLEHTGADGKPLNLAVLEPDAVVDQLVSIATEYPQAAPRLRKLLQTALDRMPT